MLSSAGVKTSVDETSFDLGKRVGGQPSVLDSASYLSSNIRQDFDAMQPKWFIEVENA